MKILTNDIVPDGPVLRVLSQLRRRLATLLLSRFLRRARARVALRLVVRRWLRRETAVVVGNSELGVAQRLLGRGARQRSSFLALRVVVGGLAARSGRSHVATAVVLVARVSRGPRLRHCQSVGRLGNAWPREASRGVRSAELGLQLAWAVWGAGSDSASALRLAAAVRGGAHLAEEGASLGSRLALS